MAEGSINLNDFDLAKLNDADKAELRQFFANEGQKARIQTTVHNLTDMCFRKCVTGAVRSGKLDRAEEGCLANCADRFIDISRLTVKHLQNMRQG
ncbi:Tim10/DDP family zinc finger-domain-containing protein [Daldinia bambusicola]|nr:Tim10/DDP family zinc finger-domain-containing protein [Daldinia bambusicola]